MLLQRLPGPHQLALHLGLLSPQLQHHVPQAVCFLGRHLAASHQLLPLLPQPNRGVLQRAHLLAHLAHFISQLGNTLLELVILLL